MYVDLKFILFWFLLYTKHSFHITVLLRVADTHVGRRVSSQHCVTSVHSCFLSGVGFWSYYDRYSLG